MRIPNAVYAAQGWRIQEIAPDFTLLDAWALPAHGRVEDFGVLVDIVTSADPTLSDSRAARSLWRVRETAGRWLGLDKASTGALPIPGSAQTLLAQRLPADLQGTAAGLSFAGLPFQPVYRTPNEFAAELSNDTVHGVLHLSWADRGGGRHQGQLGIYVRPRGLLGRAYLTVITPFRHLVIYPALLRQLGREWADRAADN